MDDRIGYLPKAAYDIADGKSECTVSTIELNGHGNMEVYVYFEEDESYSDHAVSYNKYDVADNTCELLASDLARKYDVANDTVTPIFVDEKNVKCPACGKLQRPGRYLCYNCGIKFHDDTNS